MRLIQACFCAAGGPSHVQYYHRILVGGAHSGMLFRGLPFRKFYCLCPNAPGAKHGAAAALLSLLLFCDPLFWLLRSAGVL